MRQANADEVGDSQMMAISDEGVGVGVIQKLTIADRGVEGGLWTPNADDEQDSSCGEQDDEQRFHGQEKDQEVKEDED